MYYTLPMLKHWLTIGFLTDFNFTAVYGFHSYSSTSSHLFTASELLPVTLRLQSWMRIGPN